MKKTITILGAVLFASLIQTSCGDKGKEKGNSSDAKVASSATGLTESEFTDILAEMKSEGEMDEKFITKIKSKIADLKDKKSKEDAASKDNSGDTVKVNSLAFFKDIYSDRSLYLDKYLNKTIIVTDLILTDVYTIDEDEKYIKCASAFPFDPSKNMMASYSEYDNNVMATFNGQPLTNIDVTGFVKYTSPVGIQFAQPDELKKINLLDWEGNGEDENYKTKVNIICEIKKDDISYEKGDSKENNIKAKKIFVSLKNASIYLK